MKSNYTLPQLKAANPVFFSKESRKFHGDTSYTIKGNQLIVKAEIELSDHSRSKHIAIYDIDPVNLNLVFAGHSN